METFIAYLKQWLSIEGVEIYKNVPHDLNMKSSMHTLTTKTRMRTLTLVVQIHSIGRHICKIKTYKRKHQFNTLYRTSHAIK